MSRLTLMLFTLHIDEWINYCSLVYSPSFEIKKNSAPAHSTLLKLVHKYYPMLITLPLIKNKWFSMELSRSSKWKISDLQKWIRIKKIILHEEKVEGKKNERNNRYIFSASQKKICTQHHTSYFLSNHRQMKVNRNTNIL